MGFLYKVFYVILVSGLFILTLPLQAAVALLLLCTSGLPVLYGQKRVGKDGATFTLWKFRTMAPGADKKQQSLRHLNEAKGPVFKIRNDPRFTPIGKHISHMGLDELPQLYNVLRGEMSLFGPRPLPLAEAEKLTAWQRKRHAIKPGIVSPWVFEGYHRQSFAAWMKSDIAYTKHKRVAIDLQLFVKAVEFLVRLFFREIGL